MDYCQHVTRTGVPCTTPVFFGEPVCGEHLHYANGRPTDDPSGRLCAAANADRSPCDQPRLRGYTLCRYHEVAERHERELEEAYAEEARRYAAKRGLPPRDDASPETMRSDALECALDAKHIPAMHHPGP